MKSSSIFKRLSQDKFYDSSCNSTLHIQIQTILEHESPITEDLLLKRMVNVWKFQRVGELIRKKLQGLFSRYYSSQSKSGKVYWLHKKQKETYLNFRLSTEERKLEEIPVEELKNAMEYLLSEYGEFNKLDDLFKLTGKGFGFTRLTDQARKHYQIAFKLINK